MGRGCWVAVVQVWPVAVVPWCSESGAAGVAVVLGSRGACPIWAAAPSGGRQSKDRAKGWGDPKRGGEQCLGWSPGNRE